MTIHVCDDAKKSKSQLWGDYNSLDTFSFSFSVKKDFVCPRKTLVGGMHYFADYLSSEAQLWDDVDISVHCDVQVFEWLIRYLKQGMLSDPSGKELKEPLSPPTLQMENVVSILISSHFLKMFGLVESCLNFCHDYCSEILASPCNISCINNNLINRYETSSFLALIKLGLNTYTGLLPSFHYLRLKSWLTKKTKSKRKTYYSKTSK